MKENERNIKAYQWLAAAKMKAYGESVSGGNGSAAKAQKKEIM
jgi:hypothetical protein